MEAPLSGETLLDSNFPDRIDHHRHQQRHNNKQRTWRKQGIFANLSDYCFKTSQVSWRSGFCYLNKGECNLNQLKYDSFVERVAKNNNWNNGDRHKIHEFS